MYTVLYRERLLHFYLFRNVYISDLVDIIITLAVLKRISEFIIPFFFSIESRSMKHFQPRDFGRNYEKPEVFRITIFLNGENVMICFTFHNGQVTESSTLFRITWPRFCLLHTASTRPRSGSSWRTPTETAWCPGTSCSRSP